MSMKTINTNNLNRSEFLFKPLFLFYTQIFIIDIVIQQKKVNVERQNQQETVFEPNFLGLLGPLFSVTPGFLLKNQPIRIKFVSRPAVQ